MKRFNFLKAFNSPFKRPKFKWYVGKIAIGTPYFYPRRWVKMTPKLAKEAAIKKITSWRKWNTENTDYKRKIPSYHQLYESNLKSKHAVPKKIGFDFVDLGWKTKWSSTDYRFEWSPLISFVFFKWQIVLSISVPEPNRYWEAWLYYENDTDKTKSKKERIEQCKKEFSLTWTKSNGETKETINYYDKILKPKYK
jgi:hypothetical protein